MNDITSKFRKILKQVQDDVSSDSFSRKKAFTLAEVLITLGIIGVVAALTIPTLIQNYQEKAIVTKLKQSMSLFNQAFKMAELENGPVTDWGASNLSRVVKENEDGESFTSYDTPENTASSKLYMDIFTKYLKTTKYCTPEKKQFCFASKENPSDAKLYSAILANGTSFHIYSSSADCKSVWGDTLPYQNVCAILTVKLNKPNEA